MNITVLILVTVLVCTFSLSLSLGIVLIRKDIEEQKFQIYNEALEKARKVYNNIPPENNSIKKILEKAFPELKNSKGEIIRKTIIEGLREMKNSFHTISSINIDDCIAWLEKQGEKSSWRPSEEQYKALDYAFNSIPDTELGNYYEGVLLTLIEDLHRLEKQGEQK